MSETGNFRLQGNSSYFLSPELVAKISQKDDKNTLAENSSVKINAEKIISDKDTLNKQSVLSVSSINDEFVREKQNDGLIGKFYNFLKNKTGLGLGSDKVFKTIQRYENGEISKDEVDLKINKYKISRENAVQTSGDMIAGAATLGIFFGLGNKLRFLGACFQINENHGKNIKKFAKIRKGIEKLTKASNGKMALYMIPLLAITGGLTKYIFGKAERITSKEFVADKNLPKDERKKQKKELNRAKRLASWRNFWTGAVNGMLAPVTAIAGGIAGVPIYLASTFGLRYVTNRQDKEEKSFKNFVQSLKDNAVLNTVSAVAIGAVAFKKANFSKIYTKNLSSAVDKIKAKALHPLEGLSDRTAMADIQNKLFGSDSIKSIIESNESLDKKARALIEENIFAAKFLQIYEGKMGQKGIAAGGEELAKILKENCPASRTLEQAQAEINRLWGNSDYTVQKLVGVGTVAESYIAKDKSGREVCIKIMKAGINAEKIARDKEKIVQLLTGGKKLEQCSDEVKYLVRNLEDLAAGITRETDLKLEMDAARKIAEFSKAADVVKPIGAKEGIYVMEKAPGISVKTLQDYILAKIHLSDLQKAKADGVRIVSNLDKREIGIDEAIEIVQTRIKELKGRSPDFADFELSSGQIKDLLYKYMDVVNEQYNALSRGGKTIHGDLHTGNVFINLDALKSGKGKLFTLIDTGNFIEMTSKQTAQALRLETFLSRGNVKELAQIVLDGAILPSGMTKEAAEQLVLEDLKKIFFAPDILCKCSNNSDFTELSERILRKYNIIPNNAQLNFAKARTSAETSMKALINAFFDNKYATRSVGVSDVANCVVDGTGMITTYIRKKASQRTKNMLVGGFKDFWNYMFNKNNQPLNSEELLIYKLKQYNMDNAL